MKSALQALRCLLAVFWERPLSGHFKRKLLSLQKTELQLDLYRPAGRSSGLILLLPGLARNGPGDARIQKTATGFCNAGFTVAVPKIPDWQNWQIGKKDIQLLYEIIINLSLNHNLCPQGRIAIIASGPAAGLALLSASNPEIADLISALLLVNPAVDILELARSALVTDFDLLRIIFLANFLNGPLRKGAFGKFILTVRDLCRKGMDPATAQASTKTGREEFQKLRTDAQAQNQLLQELKKDEDIASSFGLKPGLATITAPVINLVSLEKSPVESVQSQILAGQMQEFHKNYCEFYMSGLTSDFPARLKAAEILQLWKVLAIFCKHCAYKAVRAALPDYGGEE